MLSLLLKPPEQASASLYEVPFMETLVSVEHDDPEPAVLTELSRIDPPDSATTSWTLLSSGEPTCGDTERTVPVVALALYCSVTVTSAPSAWRASMASFFFFPVTSGTLACLDTESVNDPVTCSPPTGSCATTIPGVPAHSTSRIVTAFGSISRSARACLATAVSIPRTSGTRESA